MSAGSACVVVPVFNEAAVLGDVLQRLRRHFEHVICVDDGSSDASHDIALASGATVLRHAGMSLDRSLPRCSSSC